MMQIVPVGKPIKITGGIIKQVLVEKPITIKIGVIGSLRSVRALPAKDSKRFRRVSEPTRILSLARNLPRDILSLEKMVLPLQRNGFLRIT